MEGFERLRNYRINIQIDKSEFLRKKIFYILIPYDIKAVVHDL